MRLLHHHNGRSALIIASSKREGDDAQDEVVKILLAHPTVDTSLVDGDTARMHLKDDAYYEDFENGGGAGTGLTALMHAAEAGRASVVATLLDHHSTEPNALSSSQWSALALAAHQGSADCVRELLGDPRVNVNAPNSVGRSPLALAAFAGHAEVVGLLLAHHDIDPNTTVSRSTRFELDQRPGRTTCYSLLTTHYSLLTTHYPLWDPTSWCSVLRPLPLN